MTNNNNRVDYNLMVREEKLMRCETVEFKNVGDKISKINSWKKQFKKMHGFSFRYEIHTDEDLIMFIWEEKIKN